MTRESHRSRATYLPRGSVAAEVGERALEPAVDLVQSQLLVRGLDNSLRVIITQVRESAQRFNIHPAAVNSSADMISFQISFIEISETRIAR